MFRATASRRQGGDTLPGAHAAVAPTPQPPLARARRLGRGGVLAPFQVRSFRFQFPADLTTSLGFEMENVILGWYILVQTGSVLMLTVFGSLQYFGTLVAPLIGVAGDRIGHRTVLCGMRAVYATLATTLMLLALTGTLRPLYVFTIVMLSGLVRPGDLAMRSALVAETMPTDRLMAAMGASRTTTDSARIAGPLAGSAAFAAFGMAAAYMVIAGCYLVAFLLTLRVGTRRSLLHTAGTPRRSPLRDLRDGLAYVWDTPCSLAAMWLAFLVNLTAFPVTSGLLPYVAREVYHIGETGLGTLVASFASGALLGSVAVSLAGRALRPGRMMLGFALTWYVMLLVFAHMHEAATGRAMLVLAGCAQSLSLVPMTVLLLRTSGDQFRGLVMGVRMLAIYGLPIGLLMAGTLIERIGFAPTVTLYSLAGLALTLAIALRWRAALWPDGAASNQR